MDGKSKKNALTSKLLILFQDCLLHRNLIGDLKAFIYKYRFDVLVILANSLSDEEQTKRQIAVYSENLELGNQVSTWKNNLEVFCFKNSDFF